MRPPTRAAIAAGSPLTVQAGVAIAEAGGNAVDIAVAAALTASLAEILMCSLGGSGFLLLETPGSPPEAIDGADAVPSGHRHGAQGRWWDVHLPYGEGITVRAGPASVAVPGMLAALHLAWQRHGSLPWRELVAPALDLAREGFPLGRTTALWLSIAGELLFDRQEASRICFPVDPADPPREGRWCRIPGMAATLGLPTLARHPDGHGFAFGTPGASRITTAMAQVWARHRLEGLSLEEAIAAPRLHVEAERDPVLVLCEPGLELALPEPGMEVRRFAAQAESFRPSPTAGDREPWRSPAEAASGKETGWICPQGS